LLDWDENFWPGEKSRLVFVPIVNPVGVYLGTRCNGNGVDLMRNSLWKAWAQPAFTAYRITPLAWYRGDESKMEKRRKRYAELWIGICSTRLCPLPGFALGFGIQDRLWFPTPHAKLLRLYC
jgi:hypothetical protein